MDKADQQTCNDMLRTGRKLIPLLFFGVFASGYSHAFEVDGLRQEMTLSDVIEWANKRGYTYEHTGPANFIKSGNETIYSLGFCNEKLVFISNNIPYSAENYILASDKYIRIFGQPIKISTNIGAGHKGKYAEIETVWPTPDYEVSVSLFVFENHGYISVSWRSTKPCESQGKSTQLQKPAKTRLVPVPFAPGLGSGQK